MKVTLTSNLYNGYTKTKNNKKNKNMTNGITFGGPKKKFHNKGKETAGKLAQDIQATASKAISNINKTLINKGKDAAGNILENANLSKASNRIQFQDKDNNTIILTNPQYYDNNIIKSCDKQTIIKKNGLIEDTFENPQYFVNRKIKSCDKRCTIEKTLSGNKITGITKTTYENPQFDNGKMKSCQVKTISTTKYNNKGQTVSNIKTTYENLQSFDNGNMKSCKAKTISTIEYNNGQIVSNKKNTYENLQYSVLGKIQSCDKAFIIENTLSDKKITGIIKTTYENPQYDDNGKIKSCDKEVTIKQKKLSEDKTTDITETTYENPQYDDNGKMKSCDKEVTIKKTLNGDKTTGNIENTYENPKYYDNGRIKSCDKRTKKRINYIDGKITGISEYTEENLQFYANGRKKSCDKAYQLEKKLSEDGTVEVPQTETTATKLKFLEDGRIASMEEDETKLLLTGEKIIHYNYQNIDKESNIYHAEQIYKINEKSNKYTYAFDVTLKDDIILPELCVKYDPSNDSFKYMYKPTFKQDQHHTLTTSAKVSEFEMILTADGKRYVQNRDDLVNKKPAIAQNAEAWQSLSPDEQEKYLAQIKMVYTMLINIHNFGKPYVKEERSAKIF